MNFENMWSVNHGHTDIMYVFAPYSLRGRMNWFLVSGSSLSLSCRSSCLYSRGPTSSECITTSRKDPWLRESQRHVLSRSPHGSMCWFRIVYLGSQNRLTFDDWIRSAINRWMAPHISCPCCVVVIYLDPPLPHVLFSSDSSWKASSWYHTYAHS